MRRVDPKVYTKNYYLTDCTGFEEFKKSFGKILESRFIELIKYFNIKPKTKVLDIGCGRGEMVFFAAKRGANAVGIDYSKQAILLANSAKRKQNEKIQSLTKFIVMDAKELLFDDSYFDTVIMTDVVEHLYPEELDVVLKEIKRILKPGGRLIIHTAPNKLFNDIGYRFYCYSMSSLLIFMWKLFAGKNYPNITKYNQLRTDSHEIMHINEPTFFSLHNLYRKFNFKGKLFSSNITVIKQAISFKDILFNFIVFLHPLSKHFPLNIVFGSDFISVLKNIK